jgi:hypothetical protein
MRGFWRRSREISRVIGGAVLIVGAALCPLHGLDKPTGAPLVLSSIETEQGVPLAILSPDGKDVSCVTVRLHWNPQQNVGPNDDSTSFALDIAPDAPGAAIFSAQLWNASLASALAWQQPWQGARWKILQTPATDGTGINAALAVGMIATSARRPYPKDTVVIGSLMPDGSLGAVSRLAERIDAAAAEGMIRVIIPSVQRFDTDASGAVVNMVRHATDQHLDCIPVDNLFQATEAAMNDPLPDPATISATPKYNDDVAAYIADFAHREESEMTSDLQFAPPEADLPKYSPHLAALWKSIYADKDTAEQAYHGGQVYVAWRLFERANAHMHGVNALAGQTRLSFDVQAALAESDGLRQRLHDLMTPPSIDKNDLESAVLVAEMGDWAYDIRAEIEGAQLVTRQAFSQRSDATETEKERAREAILFANEEARYLLEGADFYTGLLTHVAANPIPVDENAANLLPQLIPAQLATAEIFAEGIRPRANDMRDGLLFDPRLAAYINVLRETKAAWDARQRKKEMDAAAPVALPADAATKLNASATTNVGFDPGNTYGAPHTVLVPTGPVKKLSDAAACLVWVDNDCEIATLDEKYLRLDGTIDPVTHEWQVKDRSKLDALVQSAESGARQGIAFADKAEVDTSVLDMIYEEASQLRIQGNDRSALEALRNYWRCALLGNMCWQLAYAHKAQPVDLTGGDKTKPADKADDKKPDDKTTTQTADKTSEEKAKPPEKTSGTVAATSSKISNDDKTHEPPKALPADDTNTVVTPAPAIAPAPPPETVASGPPTNAPDTAAPPRALPVTDDSSTPPPAPAPTTNTPPVAAPAPSAETGDAANIPVAPIARTEDYTGGDSSTTNAAPSIGPANPATNTP